MTSAALIEDQHVAFAAELADVARTVLRENDMARVDVSVKPDRSLVTAMDILAAARTAGGPSPRRGR